MAKKDNTIDISNDIGNLHIVAQKLRGLGHLIQNQTTGKPPPYDQELSSMGVGYILTSIGDEIELNAEGIENEVLAKRGRAKPKHYTHDHQ